MKTKVLNVAEMKTVVEGIAQDHGLARDDLGEIDLATRLSDLTLREALEAAYLAGFMAARGTK